MYVREHYSELRSKTQAFHDALFTSTLPAAVLDAISANLGILKSPTILRQENGDLWGWEGCFCDKGCCPGSCTHVWSYAYTIAYLFPSLEREMRRIEFEIETEADGFMNFRNYTSMVSYTRHDISARRVCQQRELIERIIDGAFGDILR